MIVLWGVMILAAVFWNLYRREKKAARKAREELRGGKKFLQLFRKQPEDSLCFCQWEEQKGAVRDTESGAGNRNPTGWSENG